MGNLDDESLDSSGENLVCNICNKTYKNKRTLGQHIKTHKNQEVECDICLKKIKSKKILRQHKIRLHSDEKKKYKCNFCPKRFYSSSDFQRHERTHTGEKPYRCEHCPRDFGSLSNYKLHVRRHDEDNNKNKCTACSRVFSSRNELKAHMETGNHTPISHECNVCEMTFSTRVAFYGHHNLVHKKDEKNYPCPHCNQVYDNYYKLNHHATIHNEQKHMCSTCGKKFRNKQGLSYHEKEHNPDLVKPQRKKVVAKAQPKSKCDVCGILVRTIYLEVHKKHHTDEKNFECIVCFKKFVSKGHLDGHLETHSNKKLHQCHICSRNFVRASQLKNHGRSHSKDKPYKCPTCPKAFKYPYNVAAHATTCRMGENKERLTCDICKQSFKSSKLFKIHKIKCKTENVIVVELAYDSQKNESNIQQENSSNQELSNQFSSNSIVVESFEKPITECIEMSNSKSLIVDNLKSPTTDCDIAQIEDMDIIKNSKEILVKNKLLEDSRHEDMSVYIDSKGYTSDVEVFDDDIPDSTTYYEITIQTCEQPNIDVKLKIESKIERKNTDFSEEVLIENNPQTEKLPEVLELKEDPLVKETQLIEKEVKSDLEFKCELCNKSYSKKLYLTRHMKLHTSAKRFHCRICKVSFHQKDKLIKHGMATIHLDLMDCIRFCSICDQRLDSDSFLEHDPKHDDSMSFSCFKCEKSFDDIAGISEHLKTHHIFKSFLCFMCGLNFDNAQKLCVHKQKIHKAPRTERKSNRIMEKKEVIAKPKIRIKCPDCDKSFSAEKNLKSHYKIHSGIGLSVCTFCGKKCLNRSHLNDHLVIHTKNYQYACEKCGREFTRISHLKAHSLSHEGLKNFECEICKGKFSRKDNMIQHMKIHLKKPRK